MSSCDLESGLARVPGMLLPRFEYQAPEQLEQALALLAGPGPGPGGAGAGAQLLAGGTVLLVKMKRGLLRPDPLVSLRRVPGLRAIAAAASAGQDRALRIGALATMSQLAADRALAGPFAALAEGAASVGGPLIRNRATVGGNVINARPCADTVPPLIALGARLRLHAKDGERLAELDGFIRGPGETALRPGEILGALELPVPPADCSAGSCYLKLTRRAAMEMTIVGCAASLQLGPDRRVRRARLVFTSVAPIPLRVAEAEPILEGSAATDADLAAAATAARGAARPIDDHRAPASYRAEMDVEAARRQAHLVRTDRLSSKMQSAAFLEPQCALAAQDLQGRLTLWTSTQAPHYVARTVAMVLGLPEHQVRVIMPRVGGGFGPKAAASSMELATCLLARATGRSVKTLLSREQVFLHGRARHQFFHTMTTGVDRDGRLLFLDHEALLDGGAYCSFGIATVYYAGSLLGAPYRLPNMRFVGVRAITNKPAAGAQRGHGGVIARALFEVQLDRIAEELGVDPIELRLRNVMEAGEVTCNDLNTSNLGMREGLEAVRERSGWCAARVPRPDRPSGRGLGAACGFFVSGAGYPICRSRTPHCTVEIKLDPEELSLEGGLLKVRGEPGPIAPLRDEYRREHRGWTLPEPSGPFLSFVEAARIAFLELGPIVGTGQYRPPALGGSFKGAAVGTSPAYGCSAQIAEVAVDLETGQVRVERVVAAHDCGQAINRTQVEGQLHGCISMGLGEALMEEVVFGPAGEIRNPSLADYRIATALDMPAIEAIVVESHEPNGPFGAKEVGEGGIMPTVPAVVNAIYHATGVQIEELPALPERIREGLRRGSGARRE